MLYSWERLENEFALDLKPSQFNFVNQILVSFDVQGGRRNASTLSVYID